MTDYRYWIAPGASNWNNTANWSNASGGAGGFSVPTLNSFVTFDSGGGGSCNIDTDASVKGITLLTYSGTLSQNNYEMIIDSSGGFFGSGTFDGSGADIRIAGDLFVGDSCQFTSTDATLSCDSTFLYSPTTGFFANNDGIVSFDGSGATLSTLDTTFSTLQFNAEKVRITDTVFIEDQLILKSGSARGIDASVFFHIRGDLTCETDYNRWNSFNNLLLRFDSSGYQNIEYHAGGVIPSITVNKDATTPRCAKDPIQVTCWGDSPVVIKDFLAILDGTFNTNSLDIQIGL